MSWTYFSSELDAFEIYHKVREENSSYASTLGGIAEFVPALGHALAGASGTAVSNVIVYPLDLVVTRLQVQRKSNRNEKKDPEKGGADNEDDGDDSHYTSLLDAFQKIYRNEGGVAAFYSGVDQDTLKSIADSFIFFLAYNVLWRVLERNPRAATATKAHGDNKSRIRVMQILEELGIGVAAGAITKGFTSPIQQIVTRKQTAAMQSAAKSADHKPHLRGRNVAAADIMREIYRTKGLRGFWAGYSATLLLTLNPSLTFFIDSTLRRIVRAGEKPSSLTVFLVAACGKAIASTLMYPVSMAKARAQASDSSSGSVLARIPEIAADGGLLALYAGLSGEVLNGFLKHGLTMMMKQRISAVVLLLYQKLTQALKSSR